MGILLPIVLMMAFVGLISGVSHSASSVTTNPVNVLNETAASDIHTYRMAAERYVAATPSASGDISVQSMQSYLPMSFVNSENLVANVSGHGQNAVVTVCPGGACPIAAQASPGNSGDFINHSNDRAVP